jgi:hypothetical protein
MSTLNTLCKIHGIATPPPQGLKTTPAVEPAVLIGQSTFVKIHGYADWTKAEGIKRHKAVVNKATRDI